MRGMRVDLGDPALREKTQTKRVVSQFEFLLWVSRRSGRVRLLHCTLAAPIDRRTHAEHVPKPSVEGQQVAEAGLECDRRHRLR